MLYDLYRKQKTSPQKAMEGQFLFGIYRLEEWKGLVEAFGFSPGTLVELNHMDQSRTLHKLDSYYGYCFGFVHPLKVRKEAAAGIGLYCRQREVRIRISCWIFFGCFSSFRQHSSVLSIFFRCFLNSF